MNFNILIFFLISYFICAIPFGLLISKILNKKDIRQHGSKNIGATNVARVLGKKYGLATLILDSLKGAITVILAKNLFALSSNYEKIVLLTAFIAVFAHIFPIYLKFKGGKGVATTIAVILAINPLVGLVVISSWLLIFAFSKISALSSLISTFIAILFAVYNQESLLQIILFVTLFILVFIRHIENISRIIHGKENKI
ncbi:glycerol-3-phosphate 1-O-acyltransferase PlsY, partial [Rickettsiales bacterium]|nr:glycerol-3-phosphate 1-O-acyltransferase PlsY [Rickettsiales bacterium]